MILKMIKHNLKDYLFLSDDVNGTSRLGAIDINWRVGAF
jgi:hypothetical protein